MPTPPGRLEGNVLITGGSGFLGRAILRRAEREGWPARFTVYSRDETKQWELKRRYPDVRCLLGDVASPDMPRLIAAMAGQDVVVHAAAVKYIPEAEHNVLETIDVNITGSRNVAMAAIAAGVKTVVGVSTDKACGPLNVYGMTKAVMERLFAEANRMGAARFVTVRYGNVVGSTGSVIPVFRRQIEDYGEIRVTDAGMTRFWLGVDQAVDLITFAAAQACELAGYTIIDPCPAMRIVDLAKAVWAIESPEETLTLPGPGYGETRKVVLESWAGEPRITFTGIRPGEKLHEALWNEQEAPRIQEAGDYFALQPATVPAVGGERAPYTSAAPLRWLSRLEMIDLIRDAEGV